MVEDFPPQAQIHTQGQKMEYIIIFLFSHGDTKPTLMQVFRFMDLDGDGKISSLELGKLFAGLGGHDKSVVMKEAEAILQEADLNGDGFIDFDEFLHVVRGEEDKEICSSDEDLMEVFEAFDVDRNGFISADEIRRVLRRLGLAKCSLRECRLMIRGTDKNGDGL